MATRRQSNPLPNTKRRKPATTPEGRENQLISLASDLVEQRLRDGSASAQETVHFLKLGSTREKLEQQRLAHENELMKVKMEALQSQARMEELYQEAIKAFSMYNGAETTDPADEYDG